MLMLVVTMQAQTYSQLWKNVEQMEQKDLPKSVIAEAEKIYEKAKAERNVPQMMKAYLTMMTYRGSITPDSIPVDVKRLEEWAEASSTQMQDKAVLYSILGGICIRDDFEKGNRYLHLSLKDSLKLVDYPAERLVPMVKSEETSRLYFDNNLYDLLARRAIQLWEQNQWNAQQENTRETISQTYQSLLHIYKVKGMRAAWLLTALDAYPQADEKQLREWMQEYGDLEVCAEVYLRLAQRMMREDVPAERLALLREAIARYPNYYRINALKNEEKRILQPQMRVSVDDAYPGKQMTLKVDYRNLKGFTYQVYRLNLSTDSPLLAQVDAKTVTKYGALIQEKHFQLPATPDYRSRIEKIIVEAPEAGIYYVLAVPDGYHNLKSGALLQLTSLVVIERGVPTGRQEVVVLDKQTGHPVPHAEVNIYKRLNGGYEKSETYQTDAGGTVALTGKGDQSVYWNATTPKDKAMRIQWQRFTKVREGISGTEEYVHLFTDRSVYRPGQKVYFSGIVYSRKEDVVKAKEGRELTITLLDADSKEIGKQEVKTDVFGSFQGVFELPTSGKLGVYRLETKKGMATIRVEEYKRPTFDVTFDTVRTTYQAGDTIQVTGVVRAFSGAPVQGAKVKYSVIRWENRFWRMRGIETNRVNGESVTDAQGRFEVPVHFLPLPEEGIGRMYTYQIVADVTSMSGETQTGELDLPLGKVSLFVDVPNWNDQTIVKEYEKALNLVVVNTKNIPVSTEVDYRIYSVSEEEIGEIALGECVLKGKAASNQPFVPKDIYSLPSGRYQLQASDKDETGREYEQKVTFVLFSLNDKKLPYDTEIWTYQPDDEFDSKGEATLYFGSKEKDVCLFYDVYSENGWVDSKRLEFSDSLLTFRYQYREEYGTGLQVSFLFVKNGQVYARYFEIKKPKPDKALTLKWKTFRDKLLPGSKETWTLSVLYPNGQPADAQLLATMYDASLDKLAPHQWRFALDFPRYIPVYYWESTQSRNLYWGIPFPMKTLKVQPLAYSVLEVPSIVSSGMNGLRMYKASGASVEMKYAPSAMADMALQEEILEEEIVALEDSKDIQLRTDFAETAFFYPQLRTNDKGEVNIEFTLPESLTEWKFMGLVHTRNMDYGMIEAKAIASKEFMLQPNMPRFVRVGDNVNIAASLINLSNKEVKGVARMELFVPETEKVVLVQKQPFEVKAGETGKVSFSFDVSDKYESLAVRMVADGGTFSDGEQRYLPVLNNKQKLTESVLLDVNGAGTYTFSLEDLFNHHSKSVTRPKMLVEFTGNPLWYAVQALKVVSNPENDNVLSWVSAYYANALLDHLAKTEPRVADSLKVDGMEARLSEAVMKLKDLQLANGAWSWYKGMSGSRYMTTQIVVLLERLQQMTGELPNAEMKNMLQQAWGYLNKELADEVRRMKEVEKNGVKDMGPSEVALQCLYADALNGHSNISKDVRDYLIGKLEKMSGKLTIYGKALAAIILQEAGKKAEAKEIMESMMQYSVMTEAMGRYFDTPKAHYSWFSYKIPTQVVAIEAVRRVANEEKTQEELKQWLLKQKQAQAWETSIATTDAVYALLTTGKDWLANTGNTQIKVGKQIITTPEENALGYVKEEVKGNVLNIKKVVVTKESAGMGWGAVYAEFEEDMDKVSAQGNALKVQRTLYKDGQPLGEGAILQVGDKLTIRLTVTANRDMDFVEVKDNRAACLEPVDALSGYRWNQRIGYYQETKDASTSFYMNQMRKGTYHLEYEVYVTSSGRYTQGIPVARSVYAPEFNVHGSSSTIVIPLDFQK